MAIQRIKFSRKLNFGFILASLAALLLGVTVAKAFDIVTNEFTNGGQSYSLRFGASDALYNGLVTFCDGGTALFDFKGSTFISFDANFVEPMRMIYSVWGNHGTITKYSGACGDSVVPGASLACSSVMAAAKFARYSIQDISFTGNRGIASAGFYLPGVDGMVGIDGLQFEWATRTWTGTFNTDSIPAGEYRGVYLSIFNTDGEQFKCLLGKFVVE